MHVTGRLKQAGLEQRGSILLGGIVFVFLITIVGFALFDLATVDSYLAVGSRNDQRALYTAETGLSQAFLAYAQATRPWPTAPDTPFTDQALTSDGAVARFTVTATPVAGNPNQLRLVSTGCSPKSASGGECPDRSGWAKVQTTVQASAFGFPYVVSAKKLTAGGTKTEITGNVFVNQDIQLAGTSSGNVTSATGNITGPATVTGNARAGGSISSLTVLGTQTPNSPSPSIFFPLVAPCGPPYSASIPGTSPGDYNASTGDLTLTSKVTVAAGIYCLRNLSLSGQAALEAGGLVAFYVTGTVDVAGGSLGNSHAAVNLQIYSSNGYDPSTKACSTTIMTATCSGTPSNVAFSLLGNSTADVAVYAPCSSVFLSSSQSAVNGAFVGSSVAICGNTALAYDTSLQGGTFRSGIPIGYTLGSASSWCQYSSRQSTSCS